VGEVPNRLKLRRVYETLPS